MDQETAAKNRLGRLNRLKAATATYVEEETKRIDREVSTLKAVLKGRTGGKGANKSAIAKANKASEASLLEYLSGK